MYAYRPVPVMCQLMNKASEAVNAICMDVYLMETTFPDSCSYEMCCWLSGIGKRKVYVVTSLVRLALWQKSLCLSMCFLSLE